MGGVRGEFVGVFVIGEVRRVFVTGGVRGVFVMGGVRGMLSIQLSAAVSSQQMERKG